MAERPSKEFQAFDSLMGDLLKVPKSTIHERHAEHKARAEQNLNKRWPKKGPKARTLASRVLLPSDVSSV